LKGVSAWEGGQGKLERKKKKEGTSIKLFSHFRGRKRFGCERKRRGRSGLPSRIKK